ncbi:hypothetical protein ACFLSJ_05860 [Verrucomicrobiota bacterium]
MPVNRHNHSPSDWTAVLRQAARQRLTHRPDQPRRLRPGEELLLRDFEIAEPESVWSRDPEPDKWALQPYALADGTKGRAMRVHEQVGKDNRPVPMPAGFSVDPRLIGWYAVFVSTERPKYLGGIDTRLPDRPWTRINPMEREMVRPDLNKRPVYGLEPNDIEMEVFYAVAELDGQRLHFRMPGGPKEIKYRAQRGWSTLTALRFVAMSEEQVADYRRDLLDPGTRRILHTVEMYSSVSSLDQFVEAWRRSDVWTMHLEVGAGSGGVLYPDSELEELFGSNITDDLFPHLKLHYQSIITRLREIIAAGRTPFDIVTPPLREAGIRVSASLRMDIFWGDENRDPATWAVDGLDDYPVLFNGRFYREHPELRQPGSRNLDYYYFEVREHFLARLCEAAERLDVDGINMDFTRWPPFIRPEADTHIMVDFITEARRRLDEVGCRKGRRLGLSAEVVDGYYVALSLSEQRVDLEAWLRTGALDYVCVEQTREPTRPHPPDHKIDYYIALGRRLGVPVYPRQDSLMEGMQPPCAMDSVSPWVLDDDGTWADLEEPEPVIHPYCGPMHYEKRILQLYEMGAERIGLSNRWGGWLTLRRLGHRDELEQRTRRGEVFGVRLGHRLNWERAGGARR